MNPNDSSNQNMNAAPAPESPQPFSPSPMPAGNGGGSRQRMIIMIVAIVVVLGLAGVAIAMLAGGDKKENNASTSEQSSGGNEESSSEESAVVDRTDGKLDLAKLIDNKSNMKAQDLTGKLNQQLNLNDGLSYMVTAVERNWASTDPLTKPAAGKEFIKLSMVVGNRHKTDGFNYSYSGTFTVKDAAGKEYETVFADTSETLEGGTINSGEQKSGIVVFEVPTGADIPYVVTSKKYINNQTYEEVTVASKVELK
jgi:Domain of unknown function (DUF4352)